MSFAVVKKLNSFLEKIKNASSLDEETRELIGIELFDYIQEEPVLKAEFDRRFDYLEKLSKDERFIRLQNNLFDVVAQVVSLVSIEEVTQLQKEWNNKFINRLNIKGKDSLTLVELYKALTKKDCYYLLEFHGKSYFQPEGELSIRTHIVPVRKQFDVVEGFFDTVREFIINDKKKGAEYQKIVGEYNNYWYEFDEKIYRIPKRLHVKEFEEFFLFCAEVHPRKGYEFHYDFNRVVSPVDAEKKLEGICALSIVVIEDLVEVAEKQVDDFGMPKKEISEAEKKILCILEKLENEWKLTPKQKHVLSQHFGNIYTARGGETKIGQEKYSHWMSECRISDYYEFRNILNILKEDGLIEKFEVLSEYE